MSQPFFSWEISGPLTCCPGLAHCQEQRPQARVNHSSKIVRQGTPVGQYDKTTVAQWHKIVMVEWDNETTGPWTMRQWDNGPSNKPAIQQLSTCCRCAWQGAQCQNFWMLSCLTLRGSQRAVSRHVHGRNVGQDCSSGNPIRIRYSLAC